VEIIMSTDVTEPRTPPAAASRRDPRIVTAMVAGATVIGGAFAALVLGYGPVDMNPPDGTFPAGGKTLVHPSDEVKGLQQALTRLAFYDGPIDGLRSSRTREAITGLQREAGLAQTGQMNLATWAALTSMLVEDNDDMST
jgi:peptidoglycan hydrolase-like protein with peptidoglycan-binding domain